MRIISGEFKGKRISAPANLPVRPTTDFAKEGLFNVLNNEWYFDEITVLDLFAGTGNITYEFASRGAKHITAVDQHNGCIRFINETACKIRAQDRIDAIKADVYKFLERKATQTFDIIFIDPPYQYSLEDFQKVLQLIKANGWLAEEGTLIIEHPKEYSFDDLEGFVLHKKYGNVHFSFFS